MWAAVEATLQILPRLRATMPGRTDRMPSQTPLALMSRISIGPWRATTSAISAVQPAESRTSSMTPVALPPLKRIDAAASSAPFQSTQMTVAPPAARPSAVAKPMPLPAPVTMEIRPSNCLVMVFHPAWSSGRNAARRGRGARLTRTRGSRSRPRPATGRRPLSPPSFLVGPAICSGRQHVEGMDIAKAERRIPGKHEDQHHRADRDATRRHVGRFHEGALRIGPEGASLHRHHHHRGLAQAADEKRHGVALGLADPAGDAALADDAAHRLGGVNRLDLLFDR